MVLDFGFDKCSPVQDVPGMDRSIVFFFSVGISCYLAKELQINWYSCQHIW